MKRSPSLILLIASILFVLCGIGYGFTSHIVAYRHVGKNTIAHYLASNGIGYLQMTHSSTLYIVQETAFHPAINGIHTFADGNTISFVYDPDHSTPINVKSTLGTHLSGNAYNVVEITAYDNHNQVYATVAYSKGSQGYYKNNWLFGGILILFGLLLAGAPFFFRVRSKPAVALKQAQEIIPTSDVVPSQPQEQQPGITEQDTAPHPASSPSAVTPEQLMMPRQPVQPPQTAFTNQIAATYPPAISNPPSFAGFSTQLTPAPANNPPSSAGLSPQPVPASASNPPSRGGLLSMARQQSFNNPSPTPTVQAPHLSSSTPHPQFMRVPQLSFDQPLPYQQPFSPSTPIPQESPTSPYPQGDSSDTTQQINHPPSPSSQW